ncbi:MAG TPA: CDP-2,3-bis-(O-geranylgeranyl)-sn-glycerol synthase [Methanocella sp.]|nr:CDP-2,3-bis-(O-geranylgeranyl)-sn-glycerol synthase [Methanocella sp.]
MIDVIILAIWLMIPAGLANPSAALLGGGAPIDFGKRFSDNRRILGDGKTYRGLVLGSLSGTFIGTLQIFLAPYIAPYLAGFVDPQLLVGYSPIALITMPFGALAGDIAKSFFKRRLGFERGAMFPVADQLDFVAGAWILTMIADPKWLLANFTLWVALTVIIIIPVFHVAFNIAGYKLGKKDVPW